MGGTFGNTKKKKKGEKKKDTEDKILSEKRKDTEKEFLFPSSYPRDPSFHSLTSFVLVDLPSLP